MTSSTFSYPVYTKFQYGTPEYYCELFSDILCDMGDEPSEASPDYGENTIKGLLMALDSWFEYHNKAAERYAGARERIRQALGV